MNQEAMNPGLDRAVRETRAWVNHAVIGLNLCPFAKAVEARDLIRYVATDAAEPESLLAALREELALLAASAPDRVETTLLIHPRVLADFLEFNEFLGGAEALVEEMGLAGVIQVASFHPEYQFAGTEPDDVTNATNRSPYPTLHLLREESIERAVESFPDPDSIYRANIETLRRIGSAGWAELRKRWADGGDGAPATREPGD